MMLLTTIPPGVHQTGKQQPTIAYVVGGNDPVDDWLDSVGISADVVINELDIGFAFGYAAALKCAGIRTVFFASSRHVASPRRAQRQPCGTTFRIFPPPRRYALFGRRYDLPEPKSRVSWDRLTTSLRWHFGSYLAADFRALSTTIR